MRIAGAALLALLAAVSPVAQPGEADLVSLDMGGRVESATSEGADSIGAIRLIDGNPRTYWTSATEVTYPVEIVFSFFGRQPALIQSVTIEPSPSRPARSQRRQTACSRFRFRPSRPGT